MLTAPLPSDEEARRLQALSRYEVFGTEPEPAFDRITRLAARIFRVPVVLITLIERDRQWFKSHHGVDLCATSREVSFCSHAILLPAREVFVVPDAENDPRFADNPLVTGPTRVRFYAGAPLRTPDGLALGSLCLIDTVARPDLDAGERATLADLAATVMEVFEQRLARARERAEAAERQRAEERLHRREQQFRHMAANTPGMVYQFTLNADGSFSFPFVGEGCEEFFGVGPQAIYDEPRVILNAFDPAGKKQFYVSINHSAQTLEPWQSQIRYRAPDARVALAGGARSAPAAGRRHDDLERRADGHHRAQGGGSPAGGQPRAAARRHRRHGRRRVPQGSGEPLPADQSRGRGVPRAAGGGGRWPGGRRLFSAGNRRAHPRT